MIREDLLSLPGGRRIAYAEWGDPDGTPPFFFHGGPGSRLQRPGEETTAARGVRLITVDRPPGYGLSDPQPGRRLVPAFLWDHRIAAVAADDPTLEAVRPGGAAGSLSTRR